LGLKKTRSGWQYGIWVRILFYRLFKNRDVTPFCTPLLWTSIRVALGHSAIWIAWALFKTDGKLITIEIDADLNE
jgi:hypothetical protein